MLNLLYRLRHYFAHRLGWTLGNISHNEIGVYWECTVCRKREYVPWKEVRRNIGNL